MSKKIHANDRKKYRKQGKTLLIIGTFLAMISLIGHIYFQIDLKDTPKLIKPISEMTSEPAIVLSILIFCVGLTQIILGLIYIRLCLNKE
jgi:hypothetical protein